MAATAAPRPAPAGPPTVAPASTAATTATPIRKARPRRSFRELRDQRLLERYQRDGDLAARRELVERFLPLARQLASRYSYTDEAQEDLVQVASVGLIKAVDRFEPDRASTFVNYAVPTILGELKRHFRDKGWAVHVPRAVQERVLQVNRATVTLSTDLGRAPTPREVAEHIQASVEQVLEAMEAATAYDALSLEAPPPGGEGEDRRTYADTLESEEQGYELVELGQVLSGTLKALPDRERMILHLRFVEDLTQAEIAERVGVSQMHVSRLLRRALDKLRTAGSQAA
jgi:RNA polymerase sigma-B factor